MENTCADQTTIEIQPVTNSVAQPVMTLEDYAKAINEAHQICEAADKESKRNGRDAIAAGIKAGEDLIRVKELVGHGNWLPWLKENCKDIGEKMAQRYMKLAKNDTPVSDLNQCASLRQAFIAVGALAPERYDKAPEVETGNDETVEENEAIVPETILGQMQRGFATLQKQYDTLVKLNPKLQTELLSIDLNWSLPILLQRWQHPLGDAFDYFKLPWTPAVCVRCGHIREDEEIFVPIHHWVSEYAQRNEWCEVCAQEYCDEEEPFDLITEIKLLTKNLTELKSMSVKEYTLAQKLYQLQETKIAEPEIVTTAENNVWMPTDLNDEQLTVDEIERLSPKIVIVQDKDSNTLWNVYRHVVSSAVNNGTTGRSVKFFVVDDSQSHKPVLGIGALSGDFPAMAERDEFIGWTKELREGGKLKNTAVASTIVATQPFASNFNGGKLMAALTTNQTIRDEWQSKYRDILTGMTTTSLFGVPSMYDQIKQWKRLGKTTGRVPIQPKMAIYNKWRDFLKASRSHELKELLKRNPDISGPTTNSKTKVLTMIYEAAGLSLADFQHGHRRGIYFSEFYENTKEFLCGKVMEGELRLKPLFQESVEQITNRWRKQAIARYRKLKADGKLKPEKCSYSQLGKMDFETTRKVFLDELKESSE